MGTKRKRPEQKPKTATDETKPEPGPITAVPQQRYIFSLVGGYTCELTCAERNDWQAHMTRDHRELYGNLLVADGDWQRALNTGKGDLIRLRFELDALLDRVFDVARNWHEALRRSTR